MASVTSKTTLLKWSQKTKQKNNERRAVLAFCFVHKISTYKRELGLQVRSSRFGEQHADTNLAAAVVHSGDLIEKRGGDLRATNEKIKKIDERVIFAQAQFEPIKRSIARSPAGRSSTRQLTSTFAILAQHGYFLDCAKLLEHGAHILFVRRFVQHADEKFAL